jgi:hypothetical protein
MSKSQKPRRKYDPSRWLTRIATNAERRRDANPLTDDQQRDLGLAYRLSFQAMLTRPEECHWHTLAATANIALLLCEQNFGAEYIDDIKAAQDALMRTMHRQKKTGSWAMDAEGIAAIRKALDLHDAQVEIAERGEIRKAMQEIYRRINAGDVLEVA